MGWHLFVIDAQGPAATPATLARWGYAETSWTMSVDEMIAEIEDLAPAGLGLVHGRATGVHAVARFVDDDPLALALSADGGEAATFLWQGVTSSYVFSLFRDGRPYRRLVWAEGEIVIDEGPALPAEATIDWTDAEDGLFALAGAVLGEPVADDVWMARPATILRRGRRRR